MEFVICFGITNGGKTTFIDEMMKQGYGGVQVGKEFRRRYPPDYFKGQGAPAHTALEAMEIFREQVTECVNAGSEVIYIDGQPRHEKDVDEVLAFLHDYGNVSLLIFNAPDDELRRRAEARNPDDKAAIALSLARITTDKQALYPTLIKLLSCGVPVKVQPPVFVGDSDHEKDDCVL